MVEKHILAGISQVEIEESVMMAASRSLLASDMEPSCSLWNLIVRSFAVGRFSGILVVTRIETNED